MGIRSRIRPGTEWESEVELVQGGVGSRSRICPRIEWESEIAFGRGGIKMWGICLDIVADGGKLYQRAIEYEKTSDKCTVHILQPVSDIKISVDKIMPVDKPPVFVYGELVSIIEHFGTIGRIRDIIWHFKNRDYNYYISINGRKKSKRYDSSELYKFDGQHLVRAEQK